MSASCGSVSASSPVGRSRSSDTRTAAAHGMKLRIATQWSVSAVSTSIAVRSSSSWPITLWVAISRK